MYPGQTGARRARISLGAWILEVPTFGARRQHVFWVVAVRGKVVRLQQIRDPYQRPAQIKSYHIDRIYVVPEIDWSPLNPHIFRSRHGPDARTTEHPETTSQASPSDVPPTDPNQRVPKQRAKHYRDQEHLVDSSKRARIADFLLQGWRSGSYVSSSEE